MEVKTVKMKEYNESQTRGGTRISQVKRRKEKERRAMSFND